MIHLSNMYIFNTCGVSVAINSLQFCFLRTNYYYRDDSKPYPVNVKNEENRNKYYLRKSKIFCKLNLLICNDEVMVKSYRKSPSLWLI